MYKTLRAVYVQYIRIEVVWVSLVLAGLAAFFLNDPIIHFSQTYYSPTDILQSFPTFLIGKTPLQPHNYVISDDILTYLPWHEFAAQSLQQGELPLWNPYNNGGKPLLANMQGSFFNPLVWPGFLLGQHLGLVIRAFLYLYLAGLFAFLYFKSLRLWVGAALTGAIAFMFGGMVVIWQHTELGATFILLPLVLTILEWRLTRRLSDSKFVVFLSLAIVWQVFAGHPETIFLNTAVVSLYLVFRLSTLTQSWGNWRERLRVGGLFIGAGFWGIVLGAIQLLPFLEYLGNSSALTARTGQTTHAPPRNVLAFLLPNPFGNPIYGFDLDFAKPNYSEVGGGYVGATVIFLALVGLWLARRNFLMWFWLGMSLVGLEVIYGLWPCYNIVAFLSPISIYYERLVGYVGFFLIAMMTTTLHELHTEIEKRHKVPQLFRFSLWWKFGLAGLAGSGGLVGLFWWFSGSRLVPFQDVRVAEFETRQFYFVLATFIVAMLSLVIALRWPNFRRICGVVLVVAIFGQVGWYGRSYRAATNAEYFKPQNATLDALVRSGGRVTVAGSPNLLPAEVNMRYGIEQVNGYDALEVRWFEQLRLAVRDRWPNWDNPVALNLFNVQQVLVSNKQLDFQEKTAAHTPQLERLTKLNYLNIYKNVKHQPTYRIVYNTVVRSEDQAVHDLLDGSINPLDTLVLLPGGKPTTSDTPTLVPPKVTVLSRNANHARLSVNNPHSGYLYVDQTYYPGWQARVNGHEVPLYRANVAFTALPVEAGYLTVELDYDPPSFRLGGWLSLIGLIALIGLANVGQLKRLRRNRQIAEPVIDLPEASGGLIDIGGRLG